MYEMKWNDIIFFNTHTHTHTHTHIHMHSLIVHTNQFVEKFFTSLTFEHFEHLMMIPKAIFVTWLVAFHMKCWNSNCHSFSMSEALPKCFYKFNGTIRQGERKTFLSIQKLNVTCSKYSLSLSLSLSLKFYRNSIRMRIEEIPVLAVVTAKQMECMVDENATTITIQRVNCRSRENA